jgi:hypothetical protein
MKTAVEWLLDHLERNIMWTDKAEQIAEQAKEMEKQQLKEAQVAFVSNTMGYKKLLEDQFERWYNEKFKK